MSDHDSSHTQALRVLGLTSLYPNAWQPHVASFNRQQIDALAALCRFSLVSPVFCTRLWGPKPGGDPQPNYPVRRPVYWYTPGFLRGKHGSFFLRSCLSALSEAANLLSPQVMLATWAYPDGWAAAQAAHRLDLPLVLKLHGSDINVQPNDPVRRPLIAQALAEADHVVAVSQTLADKAAELGARRESIHVVPNGVDSALFRPAEKVHCRILLSLPQDTAIVLFVGRLVDIKDPLTILKAVAGMDRPATLVMVGDGPLRDSIHRRAASLGLAERLIMAGDQPLSQVPLYMAAADCLCLASRAEGSPNVVREALCCGLPVAASDVGDVRQLVDDPSLGQVCAAGDAACFSAAISKILARPIQAEEIRRKAKVPSWQDSAAMLLEILQAAADQR